MKNINAQQTRMINDTTSALNSLSKDLGLPDAISLLEFALPRITQRCDELQRYLSDQDWEKAAQVAHKTLSSARLYSSNTLEQQLHQVHNKNTRLIATLSFQQALSEEFEGIIDTIEMWLARTRYPIY